MNKRVVIQNALAFVSKHIFVRKPHTLFDKYALDAITDHIEDLLSCQQIAQSINISTRQLERLFKKYFECTPGQYYLRLRLDAARDLLRRTSRSILDVSLATGFSSTSHL
ncbi:MAG: helix-turn-helix domain-containing protein [Cohaesibacter sp.]|nr:helix-turn-helix domain-containing protein [Cohaesibacter sp.]